MGKDSTRIICGVMLCLLLLVVGATPASARDRNPAPRLNDAPTALVGRTVAPRTGPVLVGDGRIHVLYELWLTNTRAVPASIERIDVLDANDHARVVLSLTGAGLATASTRLTGSAAGAGVVPLAQDESRIVFVDLSFATPPDVPDAVIHRVIGVGAPSSTSKSPIADLVAPVRLDAFNPPKLSAPLRGKGWVAMNGCCGYPGVHRGSLQTVNGGLEIAQRFAIDWQQLDDQGRFVVGDLKVLRNWVGYDQPVYSMEDGVVTATVDGLEDQVPGTLPDRAKITIDNIGGNYVVVDIGRGLYAFYAHLRKGTLTVRPGDRVREGQELGRLGNSGNTSAPHLHMHLMDGPSPLGSSGLPYVLRSYMLTGRIDPLQLDAADDLSGTWGNRATLPVDVQSLLPLDLHIVDFRR